MSVFEEIIDQKIIKIFQVLSSNKEEYFHLQKISRISNVPMSTTFRIIGKLVKIGLVEQMNVDKTKLYRIADNKKVDELKRALEK